MNTTELKEIITTEIIGISDDPELKLIKILKKEVSTNDIQKGVLFVKCYNFFKSNISLFKQEEKDLTKDVEEYLEPINIENLRKLINDYGNGKEYGDYLIEENIKRIVDKNRKEVEELIQIFFEIFGTED